MSRSSKGRSRKSEMLVGSCLSDVAKMESMTVEVLRFEECFLPRLALVCFFPC